jgi:predicted nucleic acid-binding Zn ribbon protein
MDDTKICPVCGEEIDADDDGCPDEGDLDTANLPKRNRRG